MSDDQPNMEMLNFFFGEDLGDDYSRVKEERPLPPTSPAYQAEAAQPEAAQKEKTMVTCRFTGLPTQSLLRRATLGTHEEIREALSLLTARHGRGQIYQAEALTALERAREEGLLTLEQAKEIICDIEVRLDKEFTGQVYLSLDGDRSADAIRVAVVDNAYALSGMPKEKLLRIKASHTLVFERAPGRYATVESARLAENGEELCDEERAAELLTAARYRVLRVAELAE